MARTKLNRKNIYQVKISLLNFKPLIWRRVLVKSWVTLSYFHEVIMITMGWDNYHLYEFVKNGRRYGVLEEEYDEDEEYDYEEVEQGMHSAELKEKKIDGNVPNLSEIFKKEHTADEDSLRSSMADGAASGQIVEFLNPYMYDDSFLQDVDKTHLYNVLLFENDKLNYTYDFGDGWEHEIVLEKVFDMDTTKTLPHCIDGREPCPLEDSGGVYGYDNMLKILKDPKHPDYAHYREFTPKNFDDRTFDVEYVNSELLSISHRVR